MNCPNCQTIMNQVKVSSVNLGFFVLFEQCPECGGLWFNRYEMVQVPFQEALKVDAVDEKALQKPVIIRENLLCPIDKLPLLQLKDINIPQNTSISRCRKCEGVWMNRGELALYKKHVQQRQKENIFKSRPSKLFSEKERLKGEKKIITAIGSQLLPMPLNLIAKKSYPREPFIVSKEGVELLKQLPQDKKVEIYRLMAREHNEEQEREERFINATINILNIVFRLLVRF